MPLLSIVIPTKNRYETLIPVIKALVQHIKGDDYEIIVHDNSTVGVNQGQKEIQAIGKNVVKYYYTELPLSVTDNTNLALFHCQGDYVTFIGDDDFVSPHILHVINLMKKSGLECLISARGNYYWSNVIVAKEYFFHYPASLAYPAHPSFDITIKDSKKEMAHVLQDGGVNALFLPALYHGIVRRDVLGKIKLSLGEYVIGGSPDIALSTALSCHISQYGYMNYPVTITGASKNSAAGMGARKAHIGRIEDVPWLPKGLVDSWDPKIPRIWTGTTIYAQTIHDVYAKMGKPYSVNYASMYANMFIREPKTRKLVYPFLVKGYKNRLKGFLFVVATLIKALLFSILYALPGKVVNCWYQLKGDLSKVVVCKNVVTVDQCMHILSDTESLKPLKD